MNFLWFRVEITELFEEFHHSGKSNGDKSQMYWPVLYHPGKQINSRYDGTRETFRKAWPSVRVIVLLRLSVEGVVPSDTRG